MHNSMNQKSGRGKQVTERITQSRGVRSVKPQLHQHLFGTDYCEFF